jgi:hypothetical protein
MDHLFSSPYKGNLLKLLLSFHILPSHPAFVFAFVQGFLCFSVAICEYTWVG